MLRPKSGVWNTSPSAPVCDARLSLGPQRMRTWWKRVFSGCLVQQGMTKGGGRRNSSHLGGMGLHGRPGRVSLGQSYGAVQAGIEGTCHTVGVRSRARGSWRPAHLRVPARCIVRDPGTTGPLLISWCCSSFNYSLPPSFAPFPSLHPSCPPALLPIPHPPGGEGSLSNQLRTEQDFLNTSTGPNP